MQQGKHVQVCSKLFTDLVKMENVFILPLSTEQKQVNNLQFSAFTLQLLLAVNATDFEVRP